ncbi:hypothetical protein ABVK25_006301 [Lepraria finkii]|uniref:Uncharacterized protein n=1 Tax=Lepraria finkii TaxID=1340010 RepID=A0ABR4B614_9LECA
MQELFTDAQRNPTSFYHEVACSGPNELIALALHPELALYLAWTELPQVLDGLQTWMSVDLSHLRFLRFEVRIAGQEGAVVHRLLSYPNNGLQNIADLTARRPYLDNGLQNTTNLPASITYQAPLSRPPSPPSYRVQSQVIASPSFSRVPRSLFTQRLVPTPTYQSPTAYSSTPITGTPPETVHLSTSIVRWEKNYLVAVVPHPARAGELCDRTMATAASAESPTRHCSSWIGKSRNRSGSLYAAVGAASFANPLPRTKHTHHPLLHFSSTHTNPRKQSQQTP